MLSDYLFKNSLFVKELDAKLILFNIYIKHIYIYINFKLLLLNDIYYLIHSRIGCKKNKYFIECFSFFLLSVVIQL